VPFWGKEGRRGKDPEKGLCLLMEVRCGPYFTLPVGAPVPCRMFRSPSKIGAFFSFSDFHTLVVCPL
jgi:hypothetical protein